MTIGVALKNKDSVSLACDSQATLGGAPYKTTATKLEQLGSYHGLIMAGAVPISKQVVHLLRGRLESEQNVTTEKIADMTSDTMASLYKEYARRFGREPTELSHELASQFLIGGWDENVGPQIYAVNSPGLFNPVDDYAIIGSGLFYAGTILKKEFVRDMNIGRGNFLATRAVLEAAEMDPYVGGELRLAFIFGPPHGYKELEGYLEGRYKPMVDKVAALRRDLDTVVLEEVEGREKDAALARLLDGVNALNLTRSDLEELNKIIKGK